MQYTLPSSYLFTSATIASVLGGGHNANYRASPITYRCHGEVELVALRYHCKTIFIATVGTSANNDSLSGTDSIGASPNTESTACHFDP